MVIRNHIAYRFLTDDSMWMEMLESYFPNLYEEFEKTDSKEVPKEVMGLYHCLYDKDNKSYVVSNSVVENLDMLKINKKDDHYNWEVFKHLPDQKVTFIFQDGSLLRMVIGHDTIWFCHISFKLDKGSDLHGKQHTVMFYIEKKTSITLCDHFNHPDVICMEEHIYKFLCFFYLTENTEEIIPPGRVHGTRKTGKTSNDFKFPITIVTSKWNITTIRTEAFGVRGHFRVQPYGSGSRYEIIFIAPFEKSGYTRKAKSLTA